MRRLTPVNTPILSDSQYLTTGDVGIRTGEGISGNGDSAMKLEGATKLNTDSDHKLLLPIVKVYISTLECKNESTSKRPRDRAKEKCSNLNSFCGIQDQETASVRAKIKKICFRIDVSLDKLYLKVILRHWLKVDHKNV